MNLRLKIPNAAFPPGGYAFRDPKTGLAFNGMEATLDGQIEKIVRHRLANPRFYPLNEPHWLDRERVRQEIFQQIHAKHPELFVGYDAPPRQTIKVVVSQPRNACVCGSIEADPVYCKTCGGSKIKAWKCKKCGVQRDA